MKKTQTKIKSEILILNRFAGGLAVYTAASGYKRGGGGRWAQDYTSEYTDVLRRAGVAYKEFNDAPRGGLNGKGVKTRRFKLSGAVRRLMASYEPRRAARQIAPSEWDKTAAAVRRVFCDESMSGKRYVKFCKPMTATPPENTVRVVGNGNYTLEVYHGGAWHIAHRIQ